MWEILRPLWDEQELRGKYQCAALRFSNNHRDIMAPSSDDLAKQEDGEGGQERWRRTGPRKRVASEQRVKLTPKLPPTRPDGWGVRTHPDGDESHAFVYDYKAARKIAAESVKLAVSKEILFLDVMLRVNSSKTQNDADGRGQERTEELIAMALTQVFDYMVRNEVTYGYVTAGESLLFLHVDQSDLQTLYCHVCLPGEDVGDQSDENWSSNRVAYTAVAQLASFCLLTLLSDALRGASLDETSHLAESTLQKWPELYEDARHVLSAGDTDSPSAPSSQSTDANFASSAGATGREITLRSRSSRKTCKTLDADAWDEDEDDDARSDGPPDTRKQTSFRKRKDGPSSGSSEDGAEIPSRVPTGPYCTQKCLLALKRGGVLDRSSPNVRLHRAAGGGSHHPISASDFTKLVSEQLHRSPYLGCDALDRSGKKGSSGVLFKLDLAPYGYTFVGKGAWSSLPTVLEHETRIYDRLDRLQGDVVPVHLGVVSLDWGHALAGGIRIHHMMLLLWAGEKAADARVPNLAAEMGRCLKAVWAEGVKHWDERDDNLLWNAERARVMLIDFDCATLVPSPLNKPLIKIAGNKRKRKGAELGNSPKRASFRGRVQVAWPACSCVHPCSDVQSGAFVSFLCTHLILFLIDRDAHARNIDRLTVHSRALAAHLLAS